MGLKLRPATQAHEALVARGFAHAPRAQIHRATPSRPPSRNPKPWPQGRACDHSPTPHVRLWQSGLSMATGPCVRPLPYAAGATVAVWAEHGRRAVRATAPLRRRCDYGGLS